MTDKREAREYVDAANLARCRVPPRDTSLVGDAVAFLQSQRWIVFDRRKVYGERDAIYQVGNKRLAPLDLIAMASRHGFKKGAFA